jgi:exodeoxyribonuclease VIII
MTKHVMWDIETLDTRASAVVLSIGAVTFNPNGAGYDEQFYTVLDLASQTAHGRTVSVDTLDWWNKQHNDARIVFTQPRAPVVEELQRLGEFLAGAAGVWGNGADFDNVIIGSLYESFGIRRPWSYGKNRCFRTINSALVSAEYQKPEREGTHHNALDDAIHQTLVLQETLRNLSVRF